ncbi:MAG: SET domain-containing protein-lysine N-methyltransferase [Blastocatellia bacterium]
MELSEYTGFRVVEAVTSKNKGLFTNRTYTAGEDIYPYDYWSREVMPMHLTNHSCDPNAGFGELGMLVALRDIAVDEELTFDYLAHPLPASPWNFECLCAANNCSGWVSAS